MGFEIIKKRRLLDALFLTHRNLANYIIEVKNIATVDVHGCELYRNRRCKLRALSAYAFNVIFKHSLVVFHIGVGSGVACSTSMGNARASMRGTGNKEVPTLFLFLNSYS